METIALETLKYPIGEYIHPKIITPAEITRGIAILKDFPVKIKLETKGLDAHALGYKHRPGGWTITQLVHHCADSHMNAYIRVKLAVTESNPTITPYMEEEWAKTTDAVDAPAEWSVQILEGMHNRWTMLLDSLKPEQLKLTYYHPQHKKSIEIANVVLLYAWHCNHHLAHIRQAKQYKNDFK